jgi:DNA-binding MarR family transcriptional regulator
MKPLDLDHYVPSLLLWVTNKLSASASRVYLAEFGIGVTEWRVLAYFVARPWTSASTAAETTGIDKSAISRSIAILHRHDALEARPAGLRKVEYALSPTGRRLYTRIYRLAIARQDALLEGVSAEEREVLARLLRTLLGNLDRVAQVGAGASGRGGKFKS